MANFPCNPMLYTPAGMHVEHGWQRPACARVGLGGEPPRRHEQFVILELEPRLAPAQVPEIIYDVVHFLQQEFPVRVVSAFPSPLGLGLFQFDDPIQRERLISASPIQFGHGHIRVLKHDEAKNFTSCVYSRESWIMFLGFSLDYQLPKFVKAVVAPFSHLLSWLEGPNKSRVLTKCLLLELARVPKHLIVSQDTLLGGTGRS